MIGKYKVIILLSYISIASASAVIINPALPYISHQINLSDGAVEWLVSIFLIGYVLGQIIYGPIAKRYGDTVTLRIGLVINILGILICMLGGTTLSFSTLLIGRFVTAIGSSAGLVCTFIILNNSLEASRARLALSFATISFALSVSLATFIGGVINTYFHWNYCFLVLLIHGLVMLGFSFMYENTKDIGYEFSLKSIVNGYKIALSSPKLIIFSLAIGVMSIFSYCYSTAGPFITHDIFGFSSAEYGLWNIMTTFGILLGSVIVARVINRFSSEAMLKVAMICFIFILIILGMFQVLGIVTPLVFFVLMTLLYFISNFIYPTASYIASNAIECKASASSAMNFVNMLVAVLGVVVMGYLPFGYIWGFIVTVIFLPTVCLVLISRFK